MKILLYKPMKIYYIIKYGNSEVRRAGFFPCFS